MNIKIALFIAISFISSECSSFSRKTFARNRDTEQNITLDTIFVKADAINNDSSQKVSKLKNISIGVVFTNSYCGGVRPSQEILEECKKEFPLINSTILFQDINDKNKSIKATTDSSGIAIVPLKSGVYNYFMTASYSKTMNCAFTSTCDIWLKKCFGQVTIVKGETDGYKIAYNFGCNPCLPPRP